MCGDKKVQMFDHKYEFTCEILTLRFIDEVHRRRGEKGSEGILCHTVAAGLSRVLIEFACLCELCAGPVAGDIFLSLGSTSDNACFGYYLSGPLARTCTLHATRHSP